MRFDDTKVIYDLECLPEYDAPEGHFATGDDDDDRRTCQWIRDELAAGNPWAWFCAKVTARYKGIDGIEGVSYLGACSYRSEEDFRQPGDYFDDMKADAAADLRKQLEKLANILCCDDKEAWRYAVAQQGFAGEYGDWLAMSDLERTEYENGAAGNPTA